MIDPARKLCFEIFCPKDKEKRLTMFRQNRIPVSYTVMNRVEAIMRLERLKWLIEHKTTGTPKELAAKLEVSERTLFRLINELSTITGCPIHYSYLHSSYIFGSANTKN